MHACLRVGRTLVGTPWALMGQALWAPLGPSGLGPCGHPSALVGWALVGPLGAWPLWAGPCGIPRALVGPALVGPRAPVGPTDPF